MLKKRSGVFGVLIAGGMLATVSWAEQVDMVEYYAFPPVTATDPFHVRRMTVGADQGATLYLTNNTTPADSLIIAGRLGIREPNPTFPLEVARNPAGNLGGLIRLRGAGANRFWEFENNTGAFRIWSENAVGAPEDRVRILQTGRMSIYPSTNKVVDPAATSMLEVGPVDNANDGAEVLWAGAVNGANPDHPYFLIENQSSQFRLRMQNGANEAIRILPTGQMGIFYNNTGVTDPLAALHLGPRDATNLGGQFLLRGAGTNRYLYFENNAQTLQVVTQDGVGIESVKMRITNTGNVSFGNPAPVPSASTKLHVAGGNLQVGVAGTGKMVIGLSAPAASPGLHIKGTTGLLMEGPINPPATKVPYAFQAVDVGGGVTDFRIGDESPALSGNAASRIVIHPVGGTAYVGVNITTPAYPFDVGLAGNDAAMFGDTAVFGAGGVLVFPYKMHVQGAVYSSGNKSEGSSVIGKTDLVRLSPTDEKNLLDKLAGQVLYRYRLKNGAGDSKIRHIGILAEEAPKEIVDDSGRAIAGSDYMSVLLAALKAQKAQIESLKSELDHLEKERAQGRP